MNIKTSLRGKTFREQLKFHLFENGTRPNGRPELMGEMWGVDEFADALAKLVRTGDARRNLDNWLRGKGCRNSWRNAVERALFGLLGANPSYDGWRTDLRASHSARPNVALQYLKEKIPEPSWNALLDELAIDLRNQGWTQEPCEHGVGCTHPLFNEDLLKKRPFLPLRMLESKWEAVDQGDYSDLKAYVEAHVNDAYFNGDKIRLCGDLPPEAGQKVPIQETDYLSSLMTDQLALHRVRSIKASSKAEPNRILWEGVGAFVGSGPSNRRRLKTLSEAHISNQIGGSTLAFSSDGHLMIVYQSKDNLQSINLLAPSGSGSLDWSDALAVPSKDLISLVEFGAKRELEEECALNASVERDVQSAVP